MNKPLASTNSLALDVRALQLLHERPTLNQRELAAQLGISLGKANYCLRALLHKGLVIAQNFKNNQNKLAYAYVLTPSGIAARAELTIEFLQVKLGEYERLSAEIADLQKDAERLNTSKTSLPSSAQWVQP